MKIYQANFDGTNWNVNERRFHKEADAIAYVRGLEGGKEAASCEPRRTG